MLGFKADFTHKTEVYITGSRRLFPRVLSYRLVAISLICNG